MPVDLHTHSTASDGTTPPTALPREAKAAGLTAFALTDHDTTDGLAACAEASAEIGIDFVPGIEVSADPGEHPEKQGTRGTLHILGLFIRHDDDHLAAIAARMKEARDERNPAIVQRLRDLGIDITYDDVLAVANAQGTAIIGRPHIAQVLVDKGVVTDIAEAFTRYLARSGKAYVRRDRLPASDAIAAIHHAGGLAVMAHPIQMGIAADANLRNFIANLKDQGLDGIETHHSDHPPEGVAQYAAIARDLDLLTSGGSDYHGSRKPIALGSVPVDDEVYRRLRAAAR